MSNRLKCFLMLSIVSLGVGCGDHPQAKFVFNERTRGLEKQAQDPVKKAIEYSFGTPVDMIGWEKLPIEYGGGIEGTALAPETDGTTKTFKAKFEKPFETFDGRSTIHWLSGVYHGKSVEVTDYSPATGEITTHPPLEVPPQADDRFVIDFGWQLKSGRQLYMKQCMHCHGVSGDGAGPTAQYLNPRPRDYRPGKFKFTSTGQNDKASRDDLARTIENGIPGTYMPSFKLFSEAESKAVVEYVRWLTMRGELENGLDNEFYSDLSKKAVKERIDGGETAEEIFEGVQENVTDAVERLSDELAESWLKAESDESVVIPKKKRPEADKASLARGRALYLSGKAKCVTCHGATGKGDGPNTRDVQQRTDGPGMNDKPGLFDTWSEKIKPRDLTRGIYRGGRRPVDLYRRIFAGIKGTPMPPFGGTLNDDEIWDLVNYVMHIPHEGRVMSTPEHTSGNVATAKHGDH